MLCTLQNQIRVELYLADTGCSENFFIIFAMTSFHQNPFVGVIRFPLRFHAYLHLQGIFALVWGGGVEVSCNDPCLIFLFV
jgi:hypothetical protein